MARGMRKLLLAAAALLAVSASQAQAIVPEYECKGNAPCDTTCAMVGIPGEDLTDGWLHFRVKPWGRVRGKIQFGTNVYLTGDPSLKLFKNWVLVEGADDDPAGNTYGWVSRRYLIPFECPWHDEEEDEEEEHIKTPKQMPTYTPPPQHETATERMHRLSK
jgi:hypothetical protein